VGRWDVAEGLALPGVERETRVGRRWWRPLVKLAALGTATATAGALVAGLALPWVSGAAGVSGLAADVLQPVHADVLDSLPVRNTAILAADGSLITEIFELNRTPIPSEAIPPVMKDALIAIEDARFLQHGGVDAEALARAVVRNAAAGTVVEGGSTLTQQLVKQIRLQEARTPQERLAATAPDLPRKLYEAQLAIGMEQRYSKDEILTRYLNRVYFGAGAYGIHEAAERYFGVRPAQLTLAQAATLAGLVQSPASYDPIASPERATVRRDLVVRRMLELGLVDRTAADEARSRPVEVTPAPPVARGCVGARLAGFFCDYVLQYLRELGVTDRQLATGGLRIHTTLDPGLQRSGDAAVREHLALDDPRAGIVSVIEPGTGRVLALSVNRIFGPDPADPRQSTVPLHLAAGQGTGSTYKIFTAAAALERGFGLRHVITTSDPYVSRVYRDGPAPYVVPNAGTYPRRLTLEQALYMSSNTYFLALEDQLGSVAGPVRMAQRMGLTSIDPVADRVVAENRGSFTFGTEATSPLALANAYATLAAGGVRCHPTPVVAVLGADDEPLPGPDGGPLLPADRCEKVLDAGLANTLNQALRKDVEPGHPGQTGWRAWIPGHQIAGKTGTSQDHFSVAFVGYTMRLAGSVMVYNPVRNQNVGGFGGRMPAQIWRAAMAPVLADHPLVPFPPAEPRYVLGTREVSPDGTREPTPAAAG
jgi:membrane peptidoglycan carboxypeptidase